mmetsp:Transcript_61978/g.117356  ORF Transcript_61978/g.117356 Transcript_61978/m.117356 type:complete len:270 (-) Transcript_61978:450-1259(-)
MKPSSGLFISFKLGPIVARGAVLASGIEISIARRFPTLRTATRRRRLPDKPTIPSSPCPVSCASSIIGTAKRASHTGRTRLGAKGGGRCNSRCSSCGVWPVPRMLAIVCSGLRAGWNVSLVGKGLLPTAGCSKLLVRTTGCIKDPTLPECRVCCGEGINTLEPASLDALRGCLSSALLTMFFSSLLNSSIAGTNTPQVRIPRKMTSDAMSQVLRLTGRLTFPATASLDRKLSMECCILLRRVTRCAAALPRWLRAKRAVNLFSDSSSPG